MGDRLPSTDENLHLTSRRSPVNEWLAEWIYKFRRQASPRSPTLPPHPQTLLNSVD